MQSIYECVFLKGMIMRVPGIHRPPGVGHSGYCEDLEGVLWFHGPRHLLEPSLHVLEAH